MRNKNKWVRKSVFWGLGVGILLSVAIIANACGRPAPAAVPTLPLAQATPLATPDYSHPQVSVVVDGLLGPIGLAELPGGSIAVAEEGSGKDDKSAGVSLILPDGQVGRLISGLPSTLDAGDLAGVPLVALSPDKRRLYVGNFGQEHLWTLPLTSAQQSEGVMLPAKPYTPDDLVPAMERLNNVYLTNPFDITFDDGTPIVTDASGNGVASETADGKTRFFHRFAKIPNPVLKSDEIEAVPTGIERLGEGEFLITLTGGCPYPTGSGQLVAVDEARNQRLLINGLTMPIDVARGPDGTLWLLEFARFTADASCFDGSGYQPRTGRLSRILPDWTLEPVLTELSFPGAVLPASDGSLYISEVLTGRVLHVTFGEPDEKGASTNGAIAAPRPTPTAATARPIADLDAALLAVVDELKLQPFPGQEIREGDTPLARLGQQLFFDPILSGDRNISCATCHHPNFAMADGRTLSIGVGGNGLGPQRTFEDHLLLGPEASPLRRLAGETNSVSGETRVSNPFAGQFIPRNSLTVLNSALLPAQFWDGRVDSDRLGAPVHTLEGEVNEMGITDALAAQALFPITSVHEMAGATFGGLPPQTIRRSLCDRVNAIAAYRKQFERIFGPGEQPDMPVTEVRLVAALAAFERQLIFTDAPWDRYLDGDRAALSEQQKRGALLFFGELKAGVNCAQCHSGDLFTDFDYHNLLVPQLGPGKGHDYTKREDWGRGAVTFDLRDRYKFRTPSLRNVSLTPPYFHDGAYPTLEAAIEHHANIWNGALLYDPSANQIPAALYSSYRSFQPQKQWSTAAPSLQEGLPLDQGDIADLVVFLQALTDPAATDLTYLTPSEVPSGFPVDGAEERQAARR